MSTNIKDFFAKFKRELKILNIKAELAHERELNKALTGHDENSVEMTELSSGVKKGGCIEDDFDEGDDEQQEVTLSVLTATKDVIPPDIEFQTKTKAESLPDLELPAKKVEPQGECITTNLREKLVKLKEPDIAYKEFEGEQFAIHLGTHHKCQTKYHKNQLEHLTGANITQYYESQLQTAAAAA